MSQSNYQLPVAYPVSPLNSPKNIPQAQGSSQYPQYPVFVPQQIQKEEEESFAASLAKDVCLNVTIRIVVGLIATGIIIAIKMNQ
jgi:hypothetical protein